MSEVRDLLERWIDYRFGDEVPDAEARFAEYRALVPGRLPDDYAEGLLFIRRAASLHDNECMSVEPSLPPIPGIFGYVGQNPPVSVLLGLQRSHSNVFEVVSATGHIIPPTLVPIGCNGSDMICLDVSEAGHGRIYHWWATGDRSAEWEGAPGWDNIFLLAHSFTDLLRRLRPAPEAEDTGPRGRICFSRI